jgi:hypothetical protein
MSKHTPGPWVCISEPEKTVVVASAEPQIDGRAFGIAIIPHHEGSDYISWDVKNANGNLIAAAPDLLEFAEVSFEAILHRQQCDVCQEKEHCDICEEITDRVIASLEIALPKARPDYYIFGAEGEGE